MDAVKAGHRDGNAQSWYTQLSRVASGVLVQCVLMCTGHQNKGGSKVNYDEFRLRQVLERIPTPARTDQPQFPPFPIATRSIGDWVTHLSQAEQQEESPTHEIPRAKSQADIVVTQDDKFAEIKATYENNDKKDAFQPRQLQDIQHASVMKTAKSHDALTVQMETIGTTVDSFLKTDFSHTLFYPPAPMVPPEWTPFLQTMAVSNVYGQVELMAGRIGQVSKGLDLIESLCHSHREQLEVKKKELVDKLTLIHTVQKKLAITVDKTMKLSDEVYNLQREVSEAMQDESIAQYVRFHDPSRNAFFSTNAHQSPSSSAMASAK
jgi:hypothetical protein